MQLFQNQYDLKGNECLYPSSGTKDMEEPDEIDFLNGSNSPCMSLPDLESVEYFSDGKGEGHSRPPPNFQGNTIHIT
jgi:hypothetical protein